MDKSLAAIDEADEDVDESQSSGVFTKTQTEKMPFMSKSNYDQYNL